MDPAGGRFIVLVVLMTTEILSTPLPSVTACRGRCEIGKVEVHNSQSTVTVLETNVAGLRNDITELRNQNTQQQNDITELRNQNTQQQNDITELRNQITELRNQNTQQRNDITEQRNQNNGKRCETGGIHFKPHVQPTVPWVPGITRRLQSTHVNFSRPFATKPWVSLAITHLDSSNGDYLRIDVGVDAISTSGFDAHAYEWLNSNNIDVLVSWVACNI